MKRTYCGVNLEISSWNFKSLGYLAIYKHLQPLGRHQDMAARPDGGKNTTDTVPYACAPKQGEKKWPQQFQAQQLWMALACLVRGCASVAVLNLPVSCSSFPFCSTKTHQNSIWKTCLMLGTALIKPYQICSPKYLVPRVAPLIFMGPNQACNCGASNTEGILMTVA